MSYMSFDEKEVPQSPKPAAPAQPAVAPVIDKPQPASAAPFALKAVIVSSSYDDFLRHTVPEGKFHFDRLVVVTSYEDKATRRVCEHYHIECVPTDVLETRKGKFCKGAGINVGLTALGIDKAKDNEWFLHLDSDIYLPPQTRSILEAANLDRTMLYGIDRFIVKGQRAWHRFREKEILHLQHENGTWVHTDAFPIGTRVMAYGGFLPLGFFQLWCPSVSGVKRYPEGHTTAAREDVAFSAKWPRSKRGHLPEIIGYHLESDDSTQAINWSGRKSSKFNITEGEE